MRCRFEKAVFESEAGFCIYSYSTKDTSVPQEARKSAYYNDRKIHFTAVGNDLPSNSVIDVELEGNWQQSKYGLQLAVTHFSEVQPQTTSSIKAYLCSGCIKGIGPATADAVVAKFGTRTLEILDTDPNQLLMVKGIAQSKLKKIVASYQESRNLRDLTTYMAPFGVSKKKIEKIYEEYGDTSLRVVKSDPFQLCRIKGFGFLTVDAIARKTNAGLKNPLRYAGAIQYTLEEAMNSGHLFLPESELMEKSHQLLNSGFEVEIIAKSEVEDALLRVHSEQMVYNERGRVYLPFERICEVKVAKRVVKMLLGTEPPEVRNVVQEIAQTESKLRQTLSPSQRVAVELCLTNTISIMTGGPGVGKTTTLRALLDIYHRVNPNHEILLAAPTGKASRRMHEQTGYPASTLHSAMGILTENDLEIPNPEFLSADLVVVDECSMVDMKLAYALFERLKPGAQLVLVGDPDQLPSVGAGNVLRELIRSSLVPTAVLNTVFRQASNSRISLNAQAVNNNDTKLLFGDDFVMLDVQDSEQAASLVMKNFLREVQANGIEAVQILSPFRKRGTVCADALNGQIRELVNPREAGKEEMKSLGRIFRVGDRIIQTRNNEDVSNGEVGIISRIYTDDDGERLVDITLLDGREVTYNDELMENVDLSYCITVHKSQGGEFSTVIIPLLKEHYVMLRRNLLYTAISRAKKKVILIGQRQAVYMAIHKNDVDKRNTVLADRITVYFDRANNVRAS